MKLIVFYLFKIDRKLKHFRFEMLRVSNRKCLIVGWWGWGKMGEFEGDYGNAFLRFATERLALFAASSDPTGGRRPCPSGDAGALRTSTAE